MSHPRWKVHAARLRFNRAAARIASAAVLTLGATMPLGRWAALAGVGTAALLGAAAALKLRGRALPAGDYNAEGGALRAAEGFAMPLGELASAWITPGRGSASVTLLRRDGATVCLTVDDVAAGDALLREAGLDARHRPLRVRLGLPRDAPLRALGALVFGGLQTLPLLALFAAWLQLGPVPRAVLFAAAALGGFFVAARTMGPPELTIGADGLTLQRGFRPRFLPYRLLQEIDRDGDELVLRLTDGHRVRVTPTSRDDARDDDLVRRVRDAMTLARAADPGAPYALLDRNGRSVAEWREALAALPQEGGYRGVGLGAAELEAVLVDASAPAERRLGAALALSARDPAAARTRVRVAAEACADPAFRDAVSAALRGELDEESAELAADESGDVTALRRSGGL